MYKLKIIFLFGISCCFAWCAGAKGMPDWVYLDNGTVRIGIDKSRGACIGYFGESKTGRNLLNHYDEGRFVQQSYYGQKDGSDWHGKPWVYNPVQGGSWDANSNDNVLGKSPTCRTGLQQRRHDTGSVYHRG